MIFNLFTEARFQRFGAEWPTTSTGISSKCSTINEWRCSTCAGSEIARIGTAQ